MTVDDVKKYCISGRVKALSDDQIQSTLSICEGLVRGLGLNYGAANFTSIFDLAVRTTIDWYVANPNSLSQSGYGSAKETYQTKLPATIRMIAKSILNSPLGELQREGGY